MTNTLADMTPLPADVTWANLSNHRPNYDKCKNHIVKWDSGTTRPFAGMPRPSNIDFEKNLKLAYADICGKADMVAAYPKVAEAVG